MNEENKENEENEEEEEPKEKDFFQNLFNYFFDEEIEENFPLTFETIDVHLFMKKLRERLAKHPCNARDQTNARIVLKEMGVPKDTIERFLDKCSDLGGFCDCEIILNAYDLLMEDI